MSISHLKVSRKYYTTRLKQADLSFYPWTISLRFQGKSSDKLFYLEILADEIPNFTKLQYKVVPASVAKLFQSVHNYTEYQISSSEYLPHAMTG